MDILKHNRLAWNREVERGNPWTVPVTTEVVEAARRGTWEIVLTPTKPVPRSWFPELPGIDLLCLASGGGQQGPILAAAGAKVTVLDNSPAQLAQDRLVARRDSLDIETVEGDMANLPMFAGESFDLIVHPVSNVFVPSVLPVWREAFRVLRRGGALLSGFVNPVRYLFDEDAAQRDGTLQVRRAIPYSDLEGLEPGDRQRYLEEGYPFEFGHTLDDLIGGQNAAGFVIAGFFEDGYNPDMGDELTKYTRTFIATRALKP